MDVKITGAAAAYSQAVGRAKQITPTPDAEPASKSGFSSLLQSTLSNAVNAAGAAEQASMQALVAPTDLSQVVMAVTNAEVTLQTVVAVRDRVIQAYQDILKMPI